MKTLIKYLLKEDTVIFFDVDGVLATYEFGANRHCIDDEEWDRKMENGEDMYATVAPIRLFQQFISQKGVDNVYVCSKANPEEMDVNLTRYPLRDYKSMWSEMNNVVKDYSKIGKRNQHAIEHNKLGKHMMHLIRLYMMCLDILENKDIVTFRSKEHNLLMSIRNGEYLDENRQPIPEFFEMVDEYEKKMKYAKENTDLPEKPDYKRIQEFVMSVNERIVRGLA